MKSETCKYPSCCLYTEETVVDDANLMLRLDNLYAMLEEEGYYTKANTVYLAKNRIQQLLSQKNEGK